MFDAILFISLLLGQLGRIQITSTVALYIQDIVLCIYFLVSYTKISKVFNKRLIKFPIWQTMSILGISLVLNVWRYSPSELFVGILYLLRFCIYLGFYYIVQADTKKSSYWYTWLYTLGIGYALVGFIQLLLYPNLRNLMYLGWDPHFNRLFSSLFDPNYTGLVLGLTLLIGFTHSSLKSKYALYALQGMLCVAFILTFSRSSLIALIVALFVLIGITRFWKYLLVIVSLISVMIVVSPLGGISTSPLRLWSITSRLETMQKGIQLVRVSPIIGYGFNMLRSIDHIGLVSPYGYISNAAGGVDNSLLFLFLTTGCLGLLIMYLWVMALIQCKTYLLGHAKTQILLFSSITMLVVHGMTTNSWFYPIILLWFAILFGVVEKKEGR